MAKTVFSSLKLFQQATFNFDIKNDKIEDTLRDSRGNLREKSLIQVSITFAMKPNSRGSDTRQDRTISTDTYTGYVVSDEGALPNSISIGMVGSGTLNNRECEAKITSVSQLFVDPITKKIIGDVVQLEVYYKSLSKS